MKNLLASTVIAALLVGCAEEPATLPSPYHFGDDGYMPAEKTAIIEEAMVRLNDALGFEAVTFKPGDYMARGMFVNEPAKDGYYAWQFFKNGKFNCAVLIGKVGTKEADYEEDVYTVMHETLHCLGIPHDEDRDSLMYKDRVRGSKKLVSESIIETVKENLL